MLTAGGEPLQMIANANERRDPDGKPLCTCIALIKATDRRRYELELLSAELAITGEKATQEVLRPEHESSELREQAGAEILQLYGVARKGELFLIFHDDRRARAGWNGSERPIPIIDVSGVPVANQIRPCW